MKRSLALAAVAVTAMMVTASGNATPLQARIVFSADRAPSVSGEIYRLKPNGYRADLSRSPYQDRAPAVSPNGKRVAFISDRSGKDGVYEVGIGGHHLVQVGPLLAGVFEPLAWQPHGGLIAFDANNRLFIARPHHKPVHVPGAIAGPQPWSPDGRVLLTTASGKMRAISPQGRVLWTAPAAQDFTAAWSSNGLAAFNEGNGSIVVYDESGHLLFRVSVGPRNGDRVSWSPDGSRFALIDWPTLREWTSTGELVLHKRLRNGDTDIAWDSPHRLIAALWPTSRWLDPRSADGTLAIVTSPRARVHSNTRFAIGVAPVRGGLVKTYAHVPGCWSTGAWQAGVGSLQFAGRSIVYENWEACDGPFSNFYSVAPDGTGLHRITNVLAQETQPALSPDGSEIAYVWAHLTGLSCAGCSDGIRIASADGKKIRTLTDPKNCTFDNSPTWSPDGTTILFSEDSCDSPSELYTLPAAGGTPHDLGLAGQEPAWGPSRIAYVAGGVWTANPDGSDPVKVATNGTHPVWSADGRLAYLTGPHGTTVVVDSTQTQLPFASVTSLAWSPDGTRFVVTAQRSKTAAPDVYMIRTDGTHPVRLTKNYDALGATWR